MPPAALPPGCRPVFRLGSLAVASEQSTVSVATQLDMRRLDRLAALGARFDGPVSAAIALFRDDWIRERELCRQLAALPRSVHVVGYVADEGPYNQNVGRNLAIREASTDGVVHLDVDFLPAIGSG